MDNLPVRKISAAKTAIEEGGAWLLFLPPNSPDLNLIELAFSKLKAHMKRLAPKTVDSLWKSVVNILEWFSKQKCANFFTASGYGPY
jgi:transposase